MSSHFAAISSIRVAMKKGSVREDVEVMGCKSLSALILMGMVASAAAAGSHSGSCVLMKPIRENRPVCRQ